MLKSYIVPAFVMWQVLGKETCNTEVHFIQYHFSSIL